MTPIELLTRIRVVSRAAVTWLVAISALVTSVAPTLPEDWQTVAATVVAWLATAVLIIRRVSPVRESARGVLPQVHGD